MSKDEFVLKINKVKVNFSDIKGGIKKDDIKDEKMKTIFLLIGVRGAGKTTLLKNLRDDNDSSICVMSSSTTRAQRENDDFIIH